MVSGFPSYNPLKLLVCRFNSAWHSTVNYRNNKKAIKEPLPLSITATKRNRTLTVVDENLQLNVNTFSESRNYSYRPTTYYPRVS